MFYIILYCFILFHGRKTVEEFSWVSFRILILLTSDVLTWYSYFLKPFPPQISQEFIQISTHELEGGTFNSLQAHRKRCSRPNISKLKVKVTTGDHMLLCNLSYHRCKRTWYLRMIWNQVEKSTPKISGF